MEVYVEGSIDADGDVSLPLPSAAILFLLRYCDTDKDSEVILVDCMAEDSVTVGFQKDCLQNIKYKAENVMEIPKLVQNCTLPVIQDVDDVMIRSGLCSVVRHIVKFSSLQPSHKEDDFLDLLGFRGGSLKACSEVSGWTKLCEIELPSSISTLIQIFRLQRNILDLQLPVDIMKLELHLEKPPLLHNDDKKKRELLKQVQKDVKSLKSETNHENGSIDRFFEFRKIRMTHGDAYYRVISRHEKEAKKFLNKGDDSVCKFGCTEDRLVRWCAKCNDRERLRQKQKRLEQNQSRTAESNHVNGVTDNNAEVTVNSMKENGDSKTDIKSMDELAEYVKSLTLNDISHEHMYAEGVSFTVADIMLYTYMYFLFESMEFKCQPLLQKLPFVHKWLKHIVTLPRVHQTSVSCGFKMAAMEQCLTLDRGHGLDLKFSIPEESLDIEEDSNEISRRYKGKVRPLKSEISRVLTKVQECGIGAIQGSHPRGEQIKVDWNSLPLAAHPKIELPEKRVTRKCEQLENLATAVQAIAKPGDIIVDFCSGGGHLGIVIAHLLPDCQVYLVENNEESLKRAKKRVLDLKMKNITLYQCNLDYFCGDFTIGVCLHACGVATDLVLQQCLDKKASFVICPCCYGSIQNTHLITYPRSQCFKQEDFMDKDVILLGHAADQTEENTELKSQGRHCMNLVDTDRAFVAREMGYDVTLCSLQPLTCTPKNNLLIGRYCMDLVDSDRGAFDAREMKYEDTPCSLQPLTCTPENNLLIGQA